MTTPVVFDINVIVNAVTGPSTDFYTWPTLPPTSSNPNADCIGVANDNFDFQLWLSPHILENTSRILLEAGVDEADVDEYLTILQEIAEASGGQVVEPKRTVFENADYEDNLILDLAAHCGAALIVSEDTDLTSMPLWRGTPVLRPQEFASRVDASRRSRGKRPTEPSTTQKRLSALSIKRAQGSPTRAPDSDAATVTFDHDIDEYQRNREAFDESLARMKKIVDDWNPHRDGASAKIERWRKNLAILEERIRNIDEVNLAQPDVALSALDSLNTKMDTALDHLDPHRSTTARLNAAAIRRDSSESVKTDVAAEAATGNDVEPEL